MSEKYTHVATIKGTRRVSVVMSAGHWGITAPAFEGDPHAVTHLPTGFAAILVGADEPMDEFVALVNELAACPEFDMRTFGDVGPVIGDRVNAFCRKLRGRDHHVKAPT